MKRYLTIGIALLVACMFLAGSISAQEAEKKEAKPEALPKVAVKPLQAKGVSSDTADALTEVLCTRLMKHKKYQVLCASDVTAILTATQQVALLGNCDDDKCYDALGKALNAPYILVGSLGKVGDLYTINLSLISTEDKMTKARVTHEVKGKESNLVQGVREAVDKLMK